MVTGRHDLAHRVIFKAISKTGSFGSCVVSKDIGSYERMPMQNLQVPETAESRKVPKWLFPPRFSDKERFISSRPDFVLVTPTSAKTRKQQTNHQFSASAVELEFLRSERRLRSGKHFA